MAPKITYNKDGSLASLEGFEAVSLYRVQTIRSGIKMNIETGGAMILTRGATITKLLQMATEYTGKTYKPRNLASKQEALADLNTWFQLMKSSIPAETR